MSLEITPKLTARLMQEHKGDLIDIMAEAIDLMQAYNGRSVTYCIVMALGGSAEEREDGSTRYKYPKYQQKD